MRMKVKRPAKSMDNRDNPGDDLLLSTEGDNGIRRRLKQGIVHNPLVGLYDQLKFLGDGKGNKVITDINKA